MKNLDASTSPMLESPRVDENDDNDLLDLLGAFWFLSLAFLALKRSSSHREGFQCELT
jgi:hypothetical protein